MTKARLAQSVEHETLNLGVVGSSPTLGDVFFEGCFNFVKKKICQKWDSNPRPHTRTRILMPLLSAGKVNLESGALDRSAILTYVLYFPFKRQQ